MNNKEAIKIAIKNLLHRKLRSWLTLLGIFIGIAAVVALVSLGQGLQGAINQQFENLGVNTITIQSAGNVGAPGSTGYGELTDHDIKIIEQINGVDAVFGRYIRNAIIESNNKIDTAVITSLPPGKNRDIFLETLHISTSEGMMLKDNDDSKIVVGSKVKIDGEKVKLRDRIKINGEEFQVKGVMKKKGNPMLDGAIIITENSFEKLFDTTGEYNLLVVRAVDTNEMESLSQEISRKLRTDRGEKLGEEDFEIATPQEILDSLRSIITTVQILIIGVAAISLIVGGIGIANTMFMAILERRREIGIMKSIGATNNDINTIFLLESGFLGMAGGIIGILLGLTISGGITIAIIKFFDINIMQFSAPWWLIIGSLLFAFILGIVSGYIPASKAAKLKPIDALKN